MTGRRQDRKPRGTGLWWAACLVLLVLATFYPMVRFGFLHWDDSVYVLENARVKAGVTWGNIWWAFSAPFFGAYCPVTMLSHMLDCTLFGLWAGGHHLTSLLWHLANTLLLFFFLRSATGERACSFWVAALFAVHPLHVESAAWISERKDVLCAFFWFSGWWAYLLWVRRPSPWRYAGAFLLFLAGLMAKAMAITFPLTLLLLDGWPLGRWPLEGEGLWSARSRRRLWSLLLEKVPFFVLVPFVAVVTIVSQRTIHALQSLEAFPLSHRLGNVPWALGQYLWHLVLPVNLSSFYPHEEGWALWAGAALWGMAAALLTAALASRFRRQPYLLMGWLLFLCTLAPVIGVFQVGEQSWANRYTYVPYVGIFFAIVWGANDLVRERPAARKILLGIGAGALLALAATARSQVMTWRDDKSFLLNQVQHARGAYQSAFALGEYDKLGEHFEEAIPAYRRALAADPKSSKAWTGLGVCLQRTGQPQEALEALQRACELSPHEAAMRFNLAQMDALLGRETDAIRDYGLTLQEDPTHRAALLYLSDLLAKRGDKDGASRTLGNLVGITLEEGADAPAALAVGKRCCSLEMWQEAGSLLEGAVAKDRGNAEAWYTLGLSRQRRGLYAPAAEAYRTSIALEPGAPQARFNLGLTLLQLKNPAGAEEQARALDALDAQQAADRLRGMIRTAPP